MAILGSGLAGEILAAKLSAFCDVTVFERGSSLKSYSPQVLATMRPLGLQSTVSYGLGGTTALWRGSMLEMERDEYGPLWPEEVTRELPCWHMNVVEHLTGERGKSAWLRKKSFDLCSGELLLRSLLVPSNPPRLARSSTWQYVSLRTDCLIERVEEYESKISVVFSDRSSIHRQSADLAIVCAGALNTPLILERSGIGGFLADKKRLTDHPMGLVAKLSIADPRRLNSILARPERLRPIIKMKDKRSGLWISFQFCPAHNLSFDEDYYITNVNGQRRGNHSPRQLLTKLMSSDFRELWINKALGRHQFGHYVYVLAMLEQEPIGCGHVSADAGGQISVAWSISEASVNALESSLYDLASWLDAELHLPPSGVASRLWSGAHHASTCPISLSALTGVVGPDLKVHGHQRLYACDASVLPSTGASHTGLTIGSLAMRLASHLSLQLTPAIDSDTWKTSDEDLSS